MYITESSRLTSQPFRSSCAGFKREGLETNYPGLCKRFVTFSFTQSWKKGDFECGNCFRRIFLILWRNFQNELNFFNLLGYKVYMWFTWSLTSNYSRHMKFQNYWISPAHADIGPNLLGAKNYLRLNKFISLSERLILESITVSLFPRVYCISNSCLLKQLKCYWTNLTKF